MMNRCCENERHQNSNINQNSLFIRRYLTHCPVFGQKIILAAQLYALTEKSVDDVKKQRIVTGVGKHLIQPFKPSHGQRAGCSLPKPEKHEDAGIEKKTARQQSRHGGRQHDSGGGRASFQLQGNTYSIGQRGKRNSRIVIRHQQKNDDTRKGYAPDDALVACAGQQYALVGDAAQQSHLFHEVCQQKAADEHPQDAHAPGPVHHLKRSLQNQNIGYRQQNAHNRAINLTENKKQDSGKRNSQKNFQFCGHDFTGRQQEYQTRQSRHNPADYRLSGISHKLNLPLQLQLSKRPP